MLVKKMARQGDVLVRRVEDTAVKAASPIEREGGRVILAHGELTGHAHAITDLAEMFGLNGDRFLAAEKGAEIRHEEHATITLDSGVFEVTIQREYVAGEIRNVAD